MSKQKNKKNNQPRKVKTVVVRPSMSWIYLPIIMIILYFAFFDRSEGEPIQCDWQTVADFVEKGDVEHIEIVNKENGNVYLRQGAVERYRNDSSVEPKYRQLPENGYQLQFTIGSVDSFRKDFDKSVEKSGTRVKLTYKKSESWLDAIGWILPWILLIGLWFFLFRGFSRGVGGGSGGIMNVGKSRAQEYDPQNAEQKITFKDVAGLEEAKVEVMEIVDFLRNADKYRKLGAKIPKGALLVGPPGTGKTLLAKAVAGEANVPFLSMSGSDFVEMFVGVGASRVRDLFETAKKKAPCIVFIDEIDAIGRARGKNAGFSGNDERENTLNQLLTEMDGFQTNSGVIIMAATNRVDILDKALMRAGRFDRQIEVTLPEVAERRQIFDVHLRKLKLDENLDREFLAKQTPGFSGADIANVCNEAALIAARNNKECVGKEDFLSAVDRIIGGLEKKSKVIKPHEKSTIAYHEAGHASVSWMLKNASPLLKVTIIPRGKALGAAWYLPEERQITTKDQMMDELASLLAGRVSEMTFFQKLSTGALNDLERATKMAYAMVVYYGMSDKVGTISYYDSTGQSDMAFTKPYSDETSKEIDAEVRRILDEAYAIAKRIIDENLDKIKSLAERLLEKEVIFTEDVEEILGKRPGTEEHSEEKLEEKSEEKPTENTNENE
ncbi:MAG: ATP-dependent zinc metalloprotease FtsH [Alistipes sp.]|nr:ATP-dependent zinc metalloprotease FtsH [Candidatus Alistipes equi]